MVTKEQTERKTNTPVSTSGCRSTSKEEPEAGLIATFPPTTSVLLLRELRVEDENCVQKKSSKK